MNKRFSGHSLIPRTITPLLGGTIENEESADQSNTTDDRTPNGNEEKIPSKTDTPWKHDIFDDPDPNMRKEPKHPQRTLFY